MTQLSEDKKQQLLREAMATIEVEVKNLSMDLAAFPPNLISLLINTYISAYCNGLAEAKQIERDVMNDLKKEF